MNEPRLRRCFKIGMACLSIALCGALGPSASAVTPEPTGLFPDSARLTVETDASGQLLSAIALSGQEVDSIRGIETLSEWTTLDTRHLTLRVNKAQEYLLTLQDHCTHLRGAQLVGVSMSNQEIWADFDYIAADGYECRIDRITRLTRNRS